LDAELVSQIITICEGFSLSLDFDIDVMYVMVFCLMCLPSGFWLLISAHAILSSQQKL